MKIELFVGVAEILLRFERDDLTVDGLEDLKVEGLDLFKLVSWVVDWMELVVGFESVANVPTVEAIHLKLLLNN